MNYIKRTITELFMTSNEKEVCEYERLLTAMSKHHHAPGADPSQYEENMIQLLNSMPGKKADETILEYVRRTNFLNLYPPIWSYVGKVFHIQNAYIIEIIK
jgi:hypothetical protein